MQSRRRHACGQVRDRARCKKKQDRSCDHNGRPSDWRTIQNARKKCYDKGLATTSVAGGVWAASSRCVHNALNLGPARLLSKLYDEAVLVGSHPPSGSAGADMSGNARLIRHQGQNMGDQRASVATRKIASPQGGHPR